MNKFLRLPDIQEIFGLSRSSIYKLISDGLFPKPIPIGSRSVGWLDEEVEMIFSARISGKNHDEIKSLVENLHSSISIRSSLLNPNNSKNLVAARDRYFSKARSAK
jgi:prophage regulatory protein